MPTAEDVHINPYWRTTQMTFHNVPVERLVSSMRGRIILGTALHMAIKELEKVEGAMRQYSTLEDMRSMLDSDIFINIHDDDEE
jgi:hypothetical protein